MDTYFQCDYCSDYVADGDDFITCDCGLRWCSIRCAKYHGYLNKKTSSSCDSCRDDNPGNLQNYLLYVIKQE
jgi:hypothetical protein